MRLQQNELKLLFTITYRFIILSYVFSYAITPIGTPFYFKETRTFDLKELEKAWPRNNQESN